MSILYCETWDVLPGKGTDYGRFISDTYIPTMTSLGLVSVGGYYVEVGFGPRIIGVNSTETLQEMVAIIGNRRFHALNNELRSLVINYRRYVLYPTGNVKREKYTIQKGVWKFNQYYDIRPGKREFYNDFVIHEHLPVMQTIDYMEVTGGWNVLFGGTSQIIAEFTVKDPENIGKLLKNEAFRDVSMKLKNEFVDNYHTRILRCTERFDDMKWVRL